MQWLAWAVSMLLLGALAAMWMTQDRHYLLQVERERMAAQVELVENNLMRQLGAVDAALLSVRRDLDFFEQPSSDLQVLNRRLEALTDAMPGVRTLSVLDGTGTLLASNRTEFLGQNFAEREYVQTAQQQPDPGLLYVSQPFRTKLGVYTINLMRLVLDDRGRVYRILTATLDPSFYETLLDSALYDPGMWVGIAHQNGMLMVVQPAKTGWVGTDMTRPGVYISRHQASGQQATVTEGLDPFTGEPSLKAFRTIQLQQPPTSAALVVAMTRHLADINQPWVSRAWLAAMLWGISVVLTAAALWLMQRHSNQVRQLLAEQDLLRRQAEEDIRRLAFYDTLTQLPNRRLLLDRLPLCLAASLRHGRYSALFFIDLDHFKTLNDSHGHSQGDELLVQVAQRLLACVREEDTVARMGGDEFVLMLPELSGSASDARVRAEAVARKVLMALSDEYQLGDLRYRCSGSVGIALFGHRTESVDQVLERADDAMYAAKSAGRNAYRFADAAADAAPAA